MSQDDSSQPDLTPKSRISRDTWLLIGALTFLIIAVALTFLFTPGSGPQISLNQTTTAGTTTPGIDTSSTSLPPDSSYPPSDETDTTGYPLPTVPTEDSAPQGPVGEDGYPLEGTSKPSLTAKPGTEGPLDAAAKTETAQPFGTPTVGGYPSYPEPDGTPPTQPTFNPAVKTATSLSFASPTRPAGTRPAGGQNPTGTPMLPPTSAPPPAASTMAPTNGLPPTSPPIVPTSAPPPTSVPDLPKEPLPTETASAVLPTSLPVDVLRGNVRWSIDQSPIILHHDVQIAPGAELIIEPGVEVRLDPGISVYVDASRLIALGVSDNHVRFVSNTGSRWSGIFGRPGSFIMMESTELSGGGAGGTMMAVEDSELVVRSSRIFDNGGGVLITDTKLELKDTEIAGNDIPFGAALEATYAQGTTVTLQRNRIGGNRLSDGAPLVRFANQSTFSTLILDISGNLLRGGTPNLQLLTNGPLQGGISCNLLAGDGLGLGLRTQTLQVSPNGKPPLGLTFENNYLDEHTPPIIPLYLKYGLGRGATSEVLIDMHNNWWGDASGPYEPDANPEGRGDSVGNNILFAPWLSQPPSCAPSH